MRDRRSQLFGFNGQRPSESLLGTQPSVGRSMETIEGISYERVADRHLCRVAVREAFLGVHGFHNRSAALRDFTPEIVEAFAVHFYLPMHQGKVAFGGLVKKLKEMIQFFLKKGKKLWTTFKELLGIDKLTELRPKHIKVLAEKGLKALKKAIGKSFKKWPLKLYTMDESKLLSVNAIIDSMMKKYPQFDKWLKKSVRPKVDQFDIWLKKYLPGISNILMVAIFIFIWLNVVEFEWDLSALGAVMIGQITLGDLIGSLPGSALGALMNGLGFGTFTLLPAAFALRLLFLMGKRYITYSGGGLSLNTDLLKQDFSSGDAALAEGG